MGETYSTLVVQPIDLVNAFKLDFCFASVIKHLTKWHMDKDRKHLLTAAYYIPLCTNTKVPDGFLFALRMYCIVNGFLSEDTCVIFQTAKLIVEGRLDEAARTIQLMNE